MKKSCRDAVCEVVVVLQLRSGRGVEEREVAFSEYMEAATPFSCCGEEFRGHLCEWVYF